jgi:hypothetical protein
MRFGRMMLCALLVAIAFLWISEEWVQAASQGWLAPGQTFQAKAEKGKVLLVKAKIKKGIICVLLKTGKKDFDWDLANNQEMTIEPFAYTTPEKSGFTLKVDHSDHPEGKLWYSYKKP